MLIDDDVQEIVLGLVNADRETLPVLLKAVGKMEREDEHTLLLGVLAHSRVCVELINDGHRSVH